MHVIYPPAYKDDAFRVAGGAQSRLVANERERLENGAYDELVGGGEAFNAMTRPRRA